MTDHYRVILVAIDGSEESRHVIQRALAVTPDAGARLHLLHVIEPLALAYGADIPIDVSDLQRGIMAQARSGIERYAAEFGIADDHLHVELGSIEKTIQDKAASLEADLIVIGCHSRSGLALLLGSTARGLVPGACCDVLAVKIPSGQ